MSERNEDKLPFNVDKLVTVFYIKKDTYTACLNLFKWQINHDLFIELRPFLQTKGQISKENTSSFSFLLCKGDNIH